MLLPFASFAPPLTWLMDALRASDPRTRFHALSPCLDAADDAATAGEQWLLTNRELVRLSPRFQPLAAIRLDRVAHRAVESGSLVLRVHVADGIEPAQVRVLASPAFVVELLSLLERRAR